VANRGSGCSGWCIRQVLRRLSFRLCRRSGHLPTSRVPSGRRRVRDGRRWILSRRSGPSWVPDRAAPPTAGSFAPQHDALLGQFTLGQCINPPVDRLVRYQPTVGVRGRTPSYRCVGFLHMQPAGDLPGRPRMPQIRLHPRPKDRIAVDLAPLRPGASGLRGRVRAHRPRRPGRPGCAGPCSSLIPT